MNIEISLNFNLATRTIQPSNSTREMINISSCVPDLNPISNNQIPYSDQFIINSSLTPTSSKVVQIPITELENQIGDWYGENERSLRTHIVYNDGEGINNNRYRINYNNIVYYRRYFINYNKRNSKRKYN